MLISFQFLRDFCVTSHNNPEPVFIMLMLLEKVVEKAVCIGVTQFERPYHSYYAIRVSLTDCLGGKLIASMSSTLDTRRPFHI